MKYLSQTPTDGLVSVLQRLHSSYQTQMSNSCFLLHFRNYLIIAKKKLLLGLLTSPVPVKRNQVEVELFYHQTDNQAKIFYIFEH